MSDVSSKIIYILLLFTLLLITLSTTNARVFYLNFNIEFDENEKANVSAVTVFLEQSEYIQKLQDLAHDTPIESDDYLVIINKTDQIIYYNKLPLITDALILLDDSNGSISTISKIELIRNKTSYFTKQISFCNNNGVCEPCKEGDCSIIESSLTCSDCESGSKDYYCDEISDGICDPDCNSYDRDCADYIDICNVSIEQQGFCSCASLDGQFCDVGETCRGDTILTSDIRSDCCTGLCVDSSEYFSEKTYLNNNVTYYNILGKKQESQQTSTCIVRGGRVCLSNEKCSNNTSKGCCYGSCVSMTNLEVSKLQFGNKSAEELVELGVLSNYYGTTNLTEIERSEFEMIDKKEQGVRNIVVKDMNKHQKTEIIQKFQKEIKGINFITFTIVLLVVLLLIFITVYFVKKKDINTFEQKPAIPEKNVPVEVQQSLQQEINMLIMKRYNYQQIRQYLIQKGKVPEIVDREIRLNYDTRLQKK